MKIRPPILHTKLSNIWDNNSHLARFPVVAPEVPLQRNVHSNLSYWPLISIFGYSIIRCSLGNETVPTTPYTTKRYYHVDINRSGAEVE